MCCWSARLISKWQARVHAWVNPPHTPYFQRHILGTLPGYVQWVENLHLNSSSGLLSAYVIMCSWESEQFGGTDPLCNPLFGLGIHTHQLYATQLEPDTCPLKGHPSHIYLFRYAYLWWPSFSDVFKVSVNICFEWYFLRLSESRHLWATFIGGFQKADCLLIGAEKTETWLYHSFWIEMTQSGSNSYV